MEFELQDEEESSIGVGMRGLSGMTGSCNLLLRVLEASDMVGLFLGVGGSVLLLRMPVRMLGLTRLAGLCLSRLSRRAGEAWTMNVSNRAC